MAEEIELLEVQDIPVEEGAGIDADNAEDVVIDFSLLSSMEEKLVSTYPKGAGRDADNAEDVVIDLSLLSSMEEKLVSTKSTMPSPFTICRVPANIRECDHAAYDPRIISIGPFHRGRENLQAMEEHKWRCLDAVLAFGKGRNNLEKFLKKMKEKETQARNCYSENIQMSSNEFVKMMLLDGCSVIYFVLQNQKDHFFEKVDFIFDNEWMPSLIKLDLLLLENQLPFFVLECLWELIGPPRDTHSDFPTLRSKALAPFEYLLYSSELKSPEEHVILHLLHFLHLASQPDEEDPGSPLSPLCPLSPSPLSSQPDGEDPGSPLSSQPDEEDPGSPLSTSACGKLSSLHLCQHIGKTLRFLCPTYLTNTYTNQSSSPEFELTSRQPWIMIPSATELQEAGVRFQLKQTRSFFEVRFEQGLMEMSRLCIFDDTNILFRNFIAFEQCFPKWGNHFTSYCCFIDYLVNTPRDVSILREADIIQNELGSDEEVALLINKLCKEITWNSNHNRVDLIRKVNQHTQKRWPKWRAKLVRDYFSNPWAIISFIAGAIILILTLLQTYFAVFAYFKPPKL